MAEKRKLDGAADISDRTGEQLIEKNPAAVALGRLGGLKGGRKGGLARAKKLSAARRREIARKGAAARWAAQESG